MIFQFCNAKINGNATFAKIFASGVTDDYHIWQKNEPNI